MPAPAPVSTSTSWPWRVSSRTLAGTSPTRYSLFLISFGTPTRIAITSDDLADLVELEPRVARKDFLGVAMAEIAQEVRFDLPLGKEFAVDHFVPEARHRPAIE